MTSELPWYRHPLAGQLARFAVVGVGSTLLSVVLFWLFLQALPTQAASALSLVLSTIANTAVNRRFTFGRTDSEGATAAHVKSLVLLAMTIGVTALALWLLDLVVPEAETLASVVAFVIGNVIATIIRFALLRRWFATAP